MALTQVGPDSEEGQVVRGQHREVIACGSTTTLTARDSGALVLFDTATGSVVTLPTPVAGMTFDFMTSVAVTSNSHKVITATIASEFILGTIFGYTTDVTEIDGFSGNGTTHVAIASNGTTTGGDLGGRYTLTAISTTQWIVTGNVFCGTATPATPFATS